MPRTASRRDSPRTASGAARRRAGMPTARSPAGTRTGSSRPAPAGASGSVVGVRDAGMEAGSRGACSCTHDTRSPQGPPVPVVRPRPARPRPRSRRSIPDRFRTRPRIPRLGADRCPTPRTPLLCFPIFARRTVTCAGLLVMTAAPAFAQTFTKITATTNPIVTDPVSPVNFSGVSWMDYDADGRVDLFVCNVALYRNLGGGSFTKIVIPGNDNRVGVSWADVDNDGDLDFATAATGGMGGSRL